jgi:AraC-like DNA-binding protein
LASWRSGSVGPVPHLVEEIAVRAGRARTGADGAGQLEVLGSGLLVAWPGREARSIRIAGSGEVRPIASHRFPKLPAGLTLRLCHRLLDDASRPETIERLAAFAGASSRTLARLFERELTMTFGRWRHQVRLARALSRLTAGEAVKSVARDAGHSSSSAFTAMFRRILGASPTRYLRQPSQGGTS